MRATVMAILMTGAFLAAPGRLMSFHAIADEAIAASPLQTLVDAATTGDTILIGPGTYVGNLTFRGKNVTLRSTHGPEVTTLDGTGPVVDIGPAGALIGFTIKNGHAFRGAGVFVRGVGSLIRGNVIQDNIASSDGAGIGGSSASPRIESNTFRNNSCVGESAGVITLVNSSSPIIVNNVFEDNPCPAIDMGLPQGFLPVVANNTIVRNRIGITIDRRVSTALQVYENNLIFDNDIGLAVMFGSDLNNPTWKHNLVYGNTINYDVIPDQTGLNGNISADPQFDDAVGGHYHLSVTSPAVDAGDNNAPGLPLTDFEGDARVLDGNGDSVAAVDIGADEYTGRNHPPIADAGPDQTLECQNGPPVAALLDGSASTDTDSTPGTNDDIVAYEWLEDFGLPSEALLGSGAQLQVYFMGGTHQVTLRVTDQAGATSLDAQTVVVQGPVSCDDENPCTADAVTPACGCDHAPTPGVACDDGNACTTVGTCDASGACGGVAPFDCNDGSVCTTDTCDPVTGCLHTNVDGACDDHNPCTSIDVCATGWCMGTVVPNGTACDDQNACTTKDACNWGWCQGSAVAEGTACNDSNPCTTGEQCRSGSCAGSVPFVESTGSPLPVEGPVGVGDVDLDGNPDLVVRMIGDHTSLVILLGDGSGGFTQGATVGIATGSSSALTAIADFNLDAKPDFAAVPSSLAQTAVATFLGDGAGGFLPAPGPAIPVDPYATDLLTADFNNDDKPDLAVVSLSAKKVTILLGDGAGGFVARTPVAAGPYPQGLATGDFNLDGKLDLAVASSSSPNGGVTILLGDGSGGLAPGPGSPHPSGDGPNSIAVGDFDHDGDQDLAVSDVGFGADTIAILEGDGQGGFGAASLESAIWDPNSVKTADMDLDGQLDLVVGFFGYNAVLILAGAGNGYSFPPAYGSPVYLSGSRVDLALADLDGDGRMDVIAATTFPSQVRILLNRSVGMACPASDDCTTNVCSRFTGQCTTVPKLFGSACDDHSPCTTNDTCIGGACAGAAVDGIDCNDGNTCTLEDTCGGGSCTGTPVPGPPEVDSGVRVARLGLDASVTWNPATGATTSSVLRGRLGSLPVGSAPADETCLVSRVPVPGATDTDVPPEGSGFWYLVRGENACGVGAYGHQEQNGVPTGPEISSTCP